MKVSFNKFTGPIVFLVSLMFIFCSTLSAATSVIENEIYRFSNLSLTFSGVQVYNTSTSEWLGLSVTTKTVNLENVYVNQSVDFLNAASLPAGNYSQVSYTISSATGTLRNSNQQTVIGVSTTVYVITCEFTLENINLTVLNTVIDLSDCITRSATGYDFELSVKQIIIDKIDIVTCDWQDFTSQRSTGTWVGETLWIDSSTPDCRVNITDDLSDMDATTAGYIYSTNAGTNWSGALDKFEYTDDTAAQQNWVKEPGSAAGDVTISTTNYKEGTKALNLPCEFTPVENTTAAWTSTFVSTLNLTTCDKFSYWLNIPDKSLVDSMVLYFQSGDGWYYDELDVDTNAGISSGWNRVVLSKIEFSTASYGDAPAGWQQINGVRYRVYGATTSYVTLTIDDLYGYSSVSYTGDSNNLTLTAVSVPFNQESGTANKIKFLISDTDSRVFTSLEYTVKITTSVPTNWTYFELSTSTGGWVDGETTEINTTTPSCRIQVQDIRSGIDTTTAGYAYSTDGGTIWHGLINDFEYESNVAAQNEWVESGDGGNVVISSDNVKENTRSLVFPCNFTGGEPYASWIDTFTAMDLSEFENIGFWLYVTNKVNVSSMTISLLSGATGLYMYNYIIQENTATFNGWNYIVLKTTDFIVSGTPAGWDFIDGAVFTFYQSTTVVDTTILADGFRAYRSAECTGTAGSTGIETVTAVSVPFMQYSFDQNKIRFLVRNTNNQLGFSDAYTVKTSTGSGIYAAQRLVRNNTGPNPEFKLGEVYSFPNPAKYGKNPVLHIEVGIADKVDIGIYTIAGELIYTTNIDGNSASVVNNKYCYEQEWDSGGYASGVYIYLIKAHKSGYADIKAVKKLAVIK
ncbi:MAG: DUF4382 domain-containing protein [Elusimicrobiota bacterium]